MESEGDASTVEPTAAVEGTSKEGRAAPRISLVRDDSDSADPVPPDAIAEDSGRESSGSDDNVVLLKSRRSSGYLPLVVVCLAVVASLGLLLVDFRLGAACLAGSVGLALLFRAVLSDKQAGLLVVRSRVFDLWFLTVLASTLALLAVIVPPPPK